MLSTKQALARDVKRFCQAAAGAAALLALAACGGPTGYSRADPIWTSPYGYSDKQMGDHEYSVVVTGNAETSRARVADIALLRAAHITEEQERTHFVILKQRSEDLVAQRPVTIPIFLGGVPIWFPAGETKTKEPHVVLVIRLLAKDEAATQDALDAAAVIEEIEPRLSAGD